MHLLCKCNGAVAVCLYPCSPEYIISWPAIKERMHVMRVLQLVLAADPAPVVASLSAISCKIVSLHPYHVFCTKRCVTIGCIDSTFNLMLTNT